MFNYNYNHNYWCWPSRLMSLKYYMDGVDDLFTLNGKQFLNSISYTGRGNHAIVSTTTAIMLLFIPVRCCTTNDTATM